MQNDQNFEKENQRPQSAPASSGGDESDIDELLDIINSRHHTPPTSQAKPQAQQQAQPEAQHKSESAGQPSANAPYARAHGDESSKLGATKKMDAVKKPSGQNIKSASSTSNQNYAGPSGGVSLDDFSDRPQQPNGTKVKKPSGKSTFYISGMLKVIIYLAAVTLVSVIISVNFIKIANDVFAFVKSDEEITVDIPENATTEQIAEILSENGVISYPGIYKKYSQFRISGRAYLAGEYAAGTHTVTPSMNYDQLLEELSVLQSSNKTVRVTIPEGYTVKEILALFEKNGMKKADEFTQALESYDYDYRFIDEMQENGGLSEYRFDTSYGYRLEGYLFPDTYDFYLDENPISVISKLLDNFERKFDLSFYDRCHELGYSVDEILTLASMIEREGKNVNDYAKISSVFHNRLNNSAQYPYLESDATVQYALGVHKTRLEAGDTSVDNPYNTYKYKGLPPGPICNPGYEAIYAALYPEDTNYYYFLSRSDGTTVYSRTYDEHLAAIAESNKLDAEQSSAEQQ